MIINEIISKWRQEKEIGENLSKKDDFKRQKMILDTE